jgi:hypothetical protein
MPDIADGVPTPEPVGDTAAGTDVMSGGQAKSMVTKN